MPLQDILDDCGFAITKYQQVHGGDINHSYCLFTRDSRYFLKVNDANRYPGMFEKEARGLNRLAENFRARIPRVIKYGVIKQNQYLLLEWIETGQPKENSWERFGAALATMHQQQQSYFGWEEDNYIGSLVQRNEKHEKWNSFFTECRIMPMVRILFDSGSFSRQDVATSEAFCKRTVLLFSPEPPALLHGDLWSGNYMIASTGEAAIYDPAIYYGHREMDIGMSKLFGGFDQRFYDAYNEVYPLEKDWLKRLPLAQLYPLLVHAVLFGGHYTARSREIMKALSS